MEQKQIPEPNKEIKENILGPDGKMRSLIIYDPTRLVGKLNGKVFSPNASYGKVVFWSKNIKNFKQGCWYEGNFIIINKDDSKVAFILPVDGEVEEIKEKVEILIKNDSELSKFGLELPEKMEVKESIKDKTTYSREIRRSDLVKTVWKSDGPVSSEWTESGLKIKEEFNLPDDWTKAEFLSSLLFYVNKKAKEQTTVSKKEAVKKVTDDILANLPAQKIAWCRIDDNNTFKMTVRKEYSYDKFSPKYLDEKFVLVSVPVEENLPDFSVPADIENIETIKTGWLKQQVSYNPGWGESDRWDDVDFKTKRWEEYVHAEYSVTTRKINIPEYLKDVDILQKESFEKTFITILTEGGRGKIFKDDGQFKEEQKSGHYSYDNLSEISEEENKILKSFDFSEKISTEKLAKIEADKQKELKKIRAEVADKVAEDFGYRDYNDACNALEATDEEGHEEMEKIRKAILEEMNRFK